METTATRRALRRDPAPPRATECGSVGGGARGRLVRVCRDAPGQTHASAAPAVGATARTRRVSPTPRSAAVARGATELRGPSSLLAEELRARKRSRASRPAARPQSPVTPPQTAGRASRHRSGASGSVTRSRSACDGRQPHARTSHRRRRCRRARRRRLPAVRSRRLRPAAPCTSRRRCRRRAAGAAVRRPGATTISVPGPGARRPRGLERGGRAARRRRCAEPERQPLAGRDDSELREWQLLHRRASARMASQSAPVSACTATEVARGNSTAASATRTGSRSPSASASALGTSSASDALTSPPQDTYTVRLGASACHRSRKAHAVVVGGSCRISTGGSRAGQVCDGTVRTATEDARMPGNRGRASRKFSLLTPCLLRHTVSWHPTARASLLLVHVCAGARILPARRLADRVR